MALEEMCRSFSIEVEVSDTSQRQKELSVRGRKEPIHDSNLHATDWGGRKMNARFLRVSPDLLGTQRGHGTRDPIDVGQGGQGCNKPFAMTLRKGWGPAGSCLLGRDFWPTE